MRLGCSFFHKLGLEPLVLISMFLWNVSAVEASGAKVSITFDDGYASTYRYALPVLDEYNILGTVYVVTGDIGNNNYMTWNQVLELQNNYGWEIGGHTVEHSELPELGSTHIALEVNRSLDTLLEHGLNTVSFASPFGAYDNRVLSEVLKRYNSHRGFWDRDDLNSLPYQRDVLMVQSVQTGIDSSQVKSWINQALNEDKWLILVYHEVLPEYDPDYEYTNTIEELTEVVEYIHSTGIQVVTPNHTLKKPGINLLGNGSFDQGLNQGWSVDNSQRVLIDNNNNGSYPSSQNSMLITGGDNPAHLFSKKISVSNSESEYSFSVFVNTDQISQGEAGFYIDEYNASGDWISGQWKGDVPPSKVTYFNFTYQPTSAEVSSFSLQTYVADNNTGPVYLDNYELYNLSAED